LGKLERVMAIGGESTGWAVQLDAETVIDGKKVTSIEVAYNNPTRLEALEDKHVEVRGVLSHRQGVESGERTVLVVSSIRRAKTITPTQAGTAALLAGPAIAAAAQS
jgi:hypothetical protein